MHRTAQTLARTLGLPRASQVGLVVEDLRRTAGQYVNLFGIGPFYLARDTGDSVCERAGRTIDSRIEIAIADAGGLQIELIEPKPDSEASIYTEHLDRHGEGLHHIGFHVRDLERRISDVRAAGIGVLQSGTIRCAGGTVTRYAYLDTQAAAGTILELIEMRVAGIAVPLFPGANRIAALTGDLEKLAL